MQNYDKLTDEQLISLYQGGDSAVLNFICEKYKPLVLKCAKPLYLVGGETEDLIQEGMIGLFSAIGDFDLESGVTFYTFALLCIRRQMMKAIDSSNRMKNAPLNSYVSIYGDGDEIGEMEFLSIESDPEILLMEAEQTSGLLKKLIDTLSPMERRVFDLYMKDMDYHEIAAALGKPDKSVDNTLTRIRAKAKQLM